MMEKEFNLKKAREEMFNQFIGTPHWAQIYRSVIKQDKEFIRLLKEGLSNDCTDCNNWNVKLIDKLTGFAE